MKRNKNLLMIIFLIAISLIAFSCNDDSNSNPTNDSTVTKNFPTDLLASYVYVSNPTDIEIIASDKTKFVSIRYDGKNWIRTNLAINFNGAEWVDGQLIKSNSKLYFSGYLSDNYENPTYSIGFVYENSSGEWKDISEQVKSALDISNNNWSIRLFSNKAENTINGFVTDGVLSNKTVISSSYLISGPSWVALGNIDSYSKRLSVCSANDYYIFDGYPISVKHFNNNYIDISPSASEYDWASNIEMVSPSEGWIAGVHYASLTSGYLSTKMIYKWDGTTWTSQNTLLPNTYPMQDTVNSTRLTNMTAAPGNVWAIGYEVGYNTGNDFDILNGLIIHYDGSTWSNEYDKFKADNNITSKFNLNSIHMNGSTICVLGDILDDAGVESISPIVSIYNGTNWVRQ